MLLSQIDSAALQTIGSDVWQRWAPIIVTFPATLEVEDKKQHDTLVRVAYFHAARTMIAAFLIQCRQCNRDFGNVRSLERVDVCWDERFASAAYNLVRWGQLQAAALETLLGNLLLHGSVPARALAQHWIDERSNDSATYGRSVLAAATLLNHAADAGWSIVWPAFQDDKAFGRDVLLHLHGASTGDMPIAPRLLDDQLADLFDYVRILFPPEDDPELPSGFVTPEQRIALWRSALVSHLVQRRTTTAHQALHRLVQTYPQDLWLRTQLSEAADALRHDAWQPPSPLVLCKLAASHDTRLVENGEQLLDVLAESLVRLATALQGETPAGQFLWDVHSEAGRKSYRPKDESALSDYIKLHLENDLRGRGIIANREVEIRKPVGDTQGERTDIQVDAIVRGPRATEFTPVTVIVEVKGCWNRDVRHAMDTQLTQRYLKDNQCRHGLYVVGWFICPQWISSDHRKRRTPWKSMTVAQEELKAQVQTLNHRPDLDVVVQCFVLDASLRV